MRSRSTRSFLLTLGCLAFVLPVNAHQHDRRDDVSPVRRIDRNAKSRHSSDRSTRSPEFRTIDGSDNHTSDSAMGAAHTPLLRNVEPDYADGVSSLAGADRPSPRAISNAVADQSESIPNPLGASDYLWQWGQFLDHDIDLTDGTDPPEPAPIAVPTGDPFFDPSGSGTVEIAFNRSLYDDATGTDASNPRQQVNEITSWIDASNVYGSDEVRARALRTLDGTGRLATSDGDLLPFNTAGLPNAGGDSASLFLAGDVRANEQVGLAAMHTLFVREHNRLVARLAERHPSWVGDRLYETARRIVGAQMQVITYREFLPALLGSDALPPYRGYDPAVNGRIANVFSTAAYRFGHSALSPTLLRVDANGREVAEGHLALREAFFAPDRLAETGIAPILRGLAAQACQRVDAYVVDDVRSFLFGPPGAGGFDLPALNIQRGRDHGLPSYNAVRQAYGLAPAASFADVSSDPEVQARLASVYASPDAIDVWVGGLAEDPLPGSHVGPLLEAVLVDQFVALRDGDRFWYARTLSDDERRRVEDTRLSDIIQRNTEIGSELGGNVHDRVLEAAGERFVLMLGGEHSVSAPAIRSHAARHDSRLTVLQFDAHADLRPEYEGSPWSHASAMARVMDVADVVGVGLRAVSQEEVDVARAHDGVHLIWADEMWQNDAWMDRAMERLGDHVYITFDVDYFDPSLVPSTGTPEPGGGDWYRTLTFLKRVFAERTVVGCDVVELAPTPGLHAPDFLVAKLVYKLLSYRFQDRLQGPS